MENYKTDCSIQAVSRQRKDGWNYNGTDRLQQIQWLPIIVQSTSQTCGEGEDVIPPSRFRLSVISKIRTHQLPKRLDSPTAEYCCSLKLAALSNENTKIMKRSVGDRN